MKLFSAEFKALGIGGGAIWCDWERVPNSMKLGWGSSVWFPQWNWARNFAAAGCVLIISDEYLKSPACDQEIKMILGASHLHSNLQRTHSPRMKPSALLPC